MGAFVALVSAGAALAGPQILSDAQLANVTAGHYDTSLSHRDAIVVGNASSADVHTLSVVGLGDSSQDGARAVTLVNAAQSSVAHGGNVLTARGAAAAGGDPSLIGQFNQILQDRPLAAYVADWQVHGVNAVSHKTENTHSAFTGRIIPQAFSFPGSITTGDPPNEQLQIGRGVAMAGAVDVTAGSGGIGFSAFAVLDTTTTTTTKFRWKFLFIDVSTEETKTVTIHEEESVSGNVTLHPFSLRAEGVVCQALVGTCQADIGHHSKASQAHETVLHPARLQGASAAHIVMSDGRLQHDKESRVTLESSAQRSVSALNIANASATALANGINIAAGTALSRAAALQQVNAITQRR